MRLRSRHAATPFPCPHPERKRGYPVSFIPTKFPVTMVADTHEYQVFDASAFGDAMFAHGHHVKEDAEPAVAAPKPAKRAK